MHLGRVVGRLWATAKDPGLNGQRLLVVQPLDRNLESAGRPLVCCDAAGAGSGELIYWCRGRESSFPFLPTIVPVDATIVGIVDRVRMEKPGED